MLFPTIKLECSEFIKECRGKPLLKYLPKGKEAFIKVKARHRKNKENKLNKIFDVAFENDNFLSKSIICNTNAGSDHVEEFYIFPINGYKFLYSKNDKNTSETYKNALLEIIDLVKENDALSLLTTILAEDYTAENLVVALDENKEVILYNIPYFYAIKRSLFPRIEDYQNIIYK